MNSRDPMERRWSRFLSRLRPRRPGDVSVFTFVSAGELERVYVRIGAGRWWRFTASGLGQLDQGASPVHWARNYGGGAGPDIVDALLHVPGAPTSPWLARVCVALEKLCASGVTAMRLAVISAGKPLNFQAPTPRTGRTCPLSTPGTARAEMAEYLGALPAWDGVARVDRLLGQAIFARDPNGAFGGVLVELTRRLLGFPPRQIPALVLARTDVARATEFAFKLFPSPFYCKGKFGRARADVASHHVLWVAPWSANPPAQFQAECCVIIGANRGALRPAPRSTVVIEAHGYDDSFEVDCEQLWAELRQRALGSGSSPLTPQRSTVSSQSQHARSCRASATSQGVSS